MSLYGRNYAAFGLVGLETTTTTTTTTEEPTTTTTTEEPEQWWCYEITESDDGEICGYVGQRFCHDVDYGPGPTQLGCGGSLLYSVIQYGGPYSTSGECDSACPSPPPPPPTTTTTTEEPTTTTEEPTTTTTTDEPGTYNCWCWRVTAVSGGQADDNYDVGDVGCSCCGEPGVENCAGTDPYTLMYPDASTVDFEVIHSFTMEGTNDGCDLVGDCETYNTTTTTTTTTGDPCGAGPWYYFHPEVGCFESDHILEPGECADCVGPYCSIEDCDTDNTTTTTTPAPEYYCCGPASENPTCIEVPYGEFPECADWNGPYATIETCEAACEPDWTWCVECADNFKICVITGSDSAPSQGEMDTACSGAGHGGTALSATGPYNPLGTNCEDMCQNGGGA